MLNVNEATEIVRKALPNGKIQKTVVYTDLYLFQVFRDTPGEEEIDPFYSVNQKTGEFNEFSILTDGDITQVLDLFVNAKIQSDGRP